MKVAEVSLQHSLRENEVLRNLKTINENRLLGSSTLSQLNLDLQGVIKVNK